MCSIKTGSPHETEKFDIEGILPSQRGIEYIQFFIGSTNYRIIGPILTFY